MEISRQPTLFETPRATVELQTVIIFALGDFQARGHDLAGRQLPFDRLRGAFRRACSKFFVPEPQEKEILNILNGLGAQIIEMPDFVAKWPFRIIISEDLAKLAAETYSRLSLNQ
jgi:hypothetical protein